MDRERSASQLRADRDEDGGPPDRERSSRRPTLFRCGSARAPGEPGALRLLSFLRALIDEGCCVRDGLQAFDWDGLAGAFAESVGSVFDALERSLYLSEFFPIAVIFVNFCLSLRDEEGFILKIPDTGLVAHRFLNASFVGCDTRLDGVALRLESLLEAANVL